MSNLSGMKLAVCIDQFFNEYEFTYPCYRLQEAGASVVVASTKVRELTGENGLKKIPEVAFADLQAAELDGIVIAGGSGPDKMQVDDA